jgi:rhodanese-related sulfurtransferase
MNFLSKRLLAEMAIITALASLIGVVWNRTLLRDAWRGKPVTGATAPAQEPGEGEQPLPLGLTQVKDFFDRHEATLVDARESLAYGRGHVAGAVSLPAGEVESGLGRFRHEVPLTALVVVYCNGFGCHDSMTVGARLLKAGYRSVFVFEGGFPEWEAAGYPVETGAPRGR